MIYTREPSTKIIRDVAEIEAETANLKATQRIGNDNLIVRFGVGQIENTTVNANTTAIFQATYTFDNPPDQSLVTITFEWYELGGNPTFIFIESRYDDPATIDSALMQRSFLAFSPDTTVLISLNAFTKSTSPGVLSFVRLQ